MFLFFSTTCPRCAPVDQICRASISLSLSYRFDHFSPRTPLLSPPQPSTVQRGLVAASAQGDSFVTVLVGSPASPALSESQRFMFGGSRSLFIPEEHRQCWNIIILQICVMTLCLCSTKSLWSLQSLSHSYTLKKHHSTQTWSNVSLLFSSLATPNQIRSESIYRGDAGPFYAYSRSKTIH